MLKDITEVETLENYHLRLRYENGIEGVVDIAGLIRFTGVFAAYFAQVRVNPDLGTICWPNEADIDPDVLYARITGEPIRLTEPVEITQNH